MAIEDRYVNLPFSEAISYLEGKINLETESSYDISDAQHDAFFISAGAKGSILTDLRSAVDRALRDGLTLEEFSKRFDSIADSWTDMRGDRDWRGKLIYQTNLRMAHAAGRYQYQLDPGVLAIQPYLQYLHGGSDKPRPSHIALHEKVFRAQELPFYPPNGYGCSCRTISLTERQLQERGLTVETIQRGDLVEYTDERGQVRQAEIQPDKGFDYIPGQSTEAQRQAAIQGILNRAPEAIRKALQAELDRINAQFAKQQKPKRTRKPKQAKTTPPTPTPSPPTTPDFPDNLEGLEEVQQLGGSTGAVLVRNPATGQQYVLKRGSSPEHLQEEFAANEAYRALGVNVPPGRLYDNGTVQLTQYIDGQPLSSLSGAAKLAAYAKLQEHFAADALLGNWDVVGLNLDNVIVDSQGEVWRIDNGGALRYRAQGTPKAGTQWNDYPTELWTMRSPDRNASTLEVFGSLGIDDIVTQIETLATQRQALLDALPADLRDTVGNRLNEMSRLAQISRTLEADRFNASYRENFLRHSLGLRDAGLVDRFPPELQLAQYQMNQVYDTQGRLFDSLRGQDNIMSDLDNYITSIGGEYRQIGEWARSQGGSSWSEPSQALKALIAESRGNWDEYFWLYGQDRARQALGQMRQAFPNADDVFVAYHAWNYEFFSRVEMPNNNTSQGLFTVYRTEDPKILRLNGVTQGSGRTMLRGAAESGSMFTPIDAVAGNALTIQEVPHHRIFGNYLHASYGDDDTGSFAGDHENEIVFLPEGIEFNYIGSLTDRRIEQYKAQGNYGNA